MEHDELYNESDALKRRVRVLEATIAGQKEAILWLLRRELEGMDGLPNMTGAPALLFEAVRVFMIDDE